MAIVHMQEYEIGDRSTDNYDFMKEKLGDVPIEGLVVHTAGSTMAAVSSGYSTSGSRESTPTGSWST